MARFLGWLVRYDDVSVIHRERCAPGGLALGVSDFEVVSGHGILDHYLRLPIGRGGVTARIDFRPEGVWIEAAVLDVQAARDAAHLVRVGVLAGWSMEFAHVGPMGADAQGLSVVTRGLITGAGLVFRPGYPLSRAYVVEG